MRVHQPNLTVEKKLWVTGERHARHTCASERCGIVGQLFFREGVQIFEERDGWARVSKFYDAACSGGKSDYVDSGEAGCEESNGIIAGKFAEWVTLDGLDPERPTDPREGAKGVAILVAGSDDYARHGTAFIAAASELIEDGSCTEADFVENGGFVKSMSERNKPVYFTYCGGYAAADKVYLNAETGEITR